MARRWLLVSAWSLLVAFAAGAAAAGESPDERAIELQIEKLLAVEEKSFDDLVRLALLNRKLDDERTGTKWLAAAASAKRSAAFGSSRSPFVYVRVWSFVPQDGFYLSVCDSGDAGFYAALSSTRGRYIRWELVGPDMLGVDRIDPLTQAVRRVLITGDEGKADFASAIGAGYDNSFALANNMILFRFAPDGRYLGQIVTMHRRKLLQAGTAFSILDGGDIYVSDHYRHISRINRHADTLKYITMRCSRSSTITAMAADKDENLVVGLSGDNQLVMLRPDLTERCRIGGPGTRPGQMLSIDALDASDRVIVVSDSAARVIHIFDKNGAFLMEIPSQAFSVSVNHRGTILALEGNRVVCYARYFKSDPPQPDREFASYLQAVGLMAEGKTENARQLLRGLARGPDANLAQVSRSLMENDTLALPRHYEGPRPLTKPEVERLIGRKVEKLFRDFYTNCVWAAPADGFLLRIDEFERVRGFDLFTDLHGLTGDLKVNAMRLYEHWCYAATNHGICRYSRKHGDWQLLPDVTDLDDVSPEGK